jgi:ribulose-5-phosphate 4-epimerase/fuculose-1-phosphate aldolase
MSSPAFKVVKSVRDQVSKEEWQTRVDLAAAYRLTDHFGMTELTANHISARVPGTNDQFLINPHGMLYDEITASSLIRIDLNGKILFNATDFDVNEAGFVIHSAIHAARHDVECVAHTHTPAGMAVSAMKCGLLPLAQTFLRFADVAYHDYEGAATTGRMDERERLVKDLGNKEAMVLKNHGLLTCGPSIPWAFNLMYRMERACLTQIMTLSCNTEYELPPVGVIAAAKQMIANPRPGQMATGDRAWPALLRRLDRIDPSYKN